MYTNDTALNVRHRLMPLVGNVVLSTPLERLGIYREKLCRGLSSPWQWHHSNFRQMSQNVFMYRLSVLKD